MRRLLLAALVVVLGAAVFFSRTSRRPVERGADAPPAARAPDASQVADGAPILPGRGADRPGLARPRSLRGTRVDGGLSSTRTVASCRRSMRAGSSTTC